MSEPITWQAVQHIRAMLQSIAVVSGYHSDLGTTEILLDRVQVLESESPQIILVAASSISTIEEKSNEKITASEMQVTIEFSQLRTHGVDAELIAHRGRADIVRALQQPLRGAPAGFTSLRITASNITAPENGAAVIVAQVTARAVLSESHPPAN